MQNENPLEHGSPPGDGGWGNSGEINLDRRGFLRLAGLLAGGFFTAGMTQAQAFFWHQPPPATAPEGVSIEPKWVEQLGEGIYGYAHFLHRLKLRNITVEQILEAHARRRGRVLNSLPPRSLWRNMKATLQAAERLAEYLGEPVEHVVSAYRNPAYNSACRAAPMSYHMRNMALDLQFRSKPRQVAAAARELRQRGVFRGGIGRYSGFTHIDTRGHPADW